MSTPAASEAAHWNLEVRCPHCGLQGTLAWDRLLPKHRVRCQRCDEWFRLDAQGLASKTEAPDAAITIAVRGASSEWKAHLAPESGRLQPRAKRWMPGRLVWAAVGAAAFALPAIGWLSLRAGADANCEAPYTEPEKLEERAAAFSLAWACNDTPAMVRFTAPGQTKPLVTWLSRTQPATVFDDARPNEVNAETISVAPQKELNRAIVTVRLALRAAEPTLRNVGGYTYREVWTQLDGKWFFAPEETINASTAPASVMPPQRR